MIEVNGKEIYTDLAEIVDPRHTALVLVDMQRDFVAPDGLFGALGIDLSMYDETLPRLAGLLGAARHHGVAVIQVAASDEIMDLWSADPREQHG